MQVLSPMYKNIPLDGTNLKEFPQDKNNRLAENIDAILKKAVEIEGQQCKDKTHPTLLSIYKDGDLGLVPGRNFYRQEKARKFKSTLKK